ncbi:MAG: hypothetical protein HQ469_00125 [Cyanobacteria bacterium]|nr:hypothetical protein [Cyanobacteria bacterium bin.275]
MQRDGAAARAGLTVGDEWLALDGIRLQTPEDALAMVRAGEPPRARQLLFSRDGLVRTTTLTPDPAAPVAWSLLLDPDGTETMAQQRRRWLTLEAP